MRSLLSRRQLLELSLGAALAGVAAAPAPVRAQNPTNLQIGMSFVNLDAASVWVAQDRHLFEKYGLNVKIINIQGGSKTVTAMVAGDVPLALIAAADVINARSRGFPIMMIGGLIHTFPYDFVVSKEITTAAQLRGSKGAISGFGSSSEFAVRYALTKLGIHPQEVTLLLVGDETSRLAALSSGQIQFTVLTAGLDLAAFDYGFKPFVKLYTMGQPYQHTGIGANIPWAKAHAGIVESFLKAIITADVYIKNPDNEAAVLPLLHRHLPIKEDHLRQGFKLYREQFYTIYPLVTERGMEFILQERKIANPASDFFDNSYVRALQNAGFAATVTGGR